MHPHHAFTNTAKTTVVLALLGAALVGAGALVGSTTGAVVGLAIGLVVIGGSYWFADRLAIRAAGARPTSEAPDVYRSVASSPRGRDADAGDLPLPRAAAQLVRHGSATPSTLRCASPPASCRCSPTPSSKASSPTSSPTSATGTS